jgi:microcystin-dependent protein
MTSFIRKHLIFGSQKDIVGDMKYSARSDDHIGWLKCDGRSLNKNTYSNLFAVIGYSFGGSGDNFNLPNPAGHVLGAIGSGAGLTTRSMGDISGTETHTLTVDELAEHTHTIDANGVHTHTINDPGHTHTFNINNTDDDNFSGQPGQMPPADANTTISSGTTNSRTTGITINSSGSHTHNAQNTGSNEPFSIMQPTLFIGNAFIYSGLRFIGTRPHRGQVYY